MAEGLTIQIGADVKNLEKELRRARQQIDRFEIQATKGGKALGKFNKAGVNAVPTVTEFSRVIQDAPFGIQGVANNLQQLTGNLGNLTTNAGGAKNAFKAIVSSLTGPAGILLAVSAVTSLLVVYGDELSGAASSANKLVDAQKDLIGGAKAEIDVYGTLLAIARDNNRSIEDRQRALNKLNSISGKYIGNLDLEGINTDEATAATDKYSQALIRQAKIKGLQNRISELYAEQAAIEGKTIKSNLNTLQQGTAFLLRYATGQGALTAAQFEQTQGAKEQNKALAEGNEELKILRKRLADILSEDIALQGLFTNVKDSVKTGVARIRAEVVNSGLVATPLTLFNIEQIQAQGVQLIETVDTTFSRVRELTFNAASAFEGIGAAIGTSLSNGTNIVQAVGGALLGAIGSISVELGRQAIAIGVGMIAIKKAFANPVTAIAAGTALVAIGSAIRNTANIVGQVGGGATGGVGGAGGGTFGGSNISLSGGGNGGGRVIFEIAGDKLIGVLNNSLNGNQSIGDAVGID
jgi:hypothetical protein